MANTGRLTALLAAARGNDNPVERDRAFEELLRLLMIFVRVGMGESLRRHRDSVDLCQSVARSFVGDLREGRLEFPTEAALVAYLQRVVRTKLAQAARHDNAAKRGGGIVLEHARNGPDALPSQVPTASMDAVGGESARRWLDALSPDERDLIRLRQAGLAWDQIGHRLGKSPESLRQTWSRLQRRFEHDAG
ncbi:MAG: hypothetical protein KF787_01055 [Phycisphaeraceae bacterium]|nr:hypothetical protein [Phycisphaerae bacterium]MBX3391211.1 hypothetical protein [Phycisphaeraceae bacterium]